MANQFKNALVSVSDKTGLAEWLKPLQAKGMRIVSTGGSAKLLREAGLKVVEVQEQTDFPEIMDGRVKTLHPKVHMALLARPGHAEDQKILKSYEVEPFDLVVVNLYPFEETLKKKASFEDLIENIDIGGPSLLRAAAKNFAQATVVVDPKDYSRLQSIPSLEDRQELAAKAFVHVSSYDAMISQTLAPKSVFPEFSLGGSLVQPLRYGENPHQKAFWFKRRGALQGWHDAKILQGKELSYNNLLDLEAAAGLLRDLSGPACVAVKHNSPCGSALGESVSMAVESCCQSDPVSVFGGIVAINGPVDGPTAEFLSSIFLECVVAPSFSPEALTVLAKKKNLRLLEWTSLGNREEFWKVQSVLGGFLLQEPDRLSSWSSAWKVMGEDPTPEIRKELTFAWAVCASLKSNAIAITADNRTVGLGMGQVNRVDAVELAVARMKRFHPEVIHPVLASDAFFPFADSIEVIHRAGIRWIIQPGGSIRDDEVLKKAQDLGVNMVLTGQRHFRH
ncbi:MAG: bifunctional phosphoribosylaminoimidazolecarboxamide formyltransferase/IMP cyclohydrolase [Bdellovibrionales bacterium]